MLIEASVAAGSLKPWKMPLILFGLVGWAAWGYFLVRIAVLQRRLRLNPALAAAINDEWVKEIRRISYAIGFWTIMIFQGLLVAVASFVTFPALVAAQVTLAVGVVSASVAFLILGRERGNG